MNRSHGPNGRRVFHPPAVSTKARGAPERFDTFLCHNAEDKPFVRNIARKLMSHGLRPWLDESELRPGWTWQQCLEAQIANIRTATVLIGQAGIGPWQHFEIEAFLREFLRRNCPVIPVILRSVRVLPELPLFLRGMTWVDFRVNRPPPFERLLWGITGVRSEGDADCRSPKQQSNKELNVNKTGDVINISSHFSKRKPHEKVDIKPQKNVR